LRFFDQKKKQFLICKIFKIEKDIRRVFIASLVFNNTTSIPLVIVIAIAKDIAPFSEDKTAGTRGIAYVGMYMSIMATLMWTWGYNYLIKSHAETENDLKHKKLDDGVPTSNNIEEGSQTPSGVTSVSVSLDDSSVISESEEDANNINEETSPNANTLPDGSVITYGARTWYKRLFAALQSPQFKQVFNPNFIAVLVAIFIVVIPPLQRLLFGANAPLSFIIDSLSMMGEINVPGVLLLLGASLAFGPKLSASLGDTDQKLTPKIIVLNVVARLAIMGGLGFLIATIMMRLDLFPDDPIFVFVLLIQPAMPTNLSLIVICQLSKTDTQTRILSPLLFFQYMACLVTTIVVVTIALEILV
jgi:predicted permease